MILYVKYVILSMVTAIFFTLCISGCSDDSGTTGPSNGDGHSDLTAGVVYNLDEPGALAHLTTDNSDNLYTYYVGTAKEIWKIDPDGVKSVFATNDQLDAVDGDVTSLYFNQTDEKLCAIMGYNLVEFDDSGNPTAFFTDGQTLGFSSPAYLTMCSEGNYYVSNFMGGQQKVFKITPDGTGSVFVAPTDDPTGIGQTYFKSSGDMIYLSNGFYRVPAGSNTSEKIFPTLSDDIFAAFEADSTVPGDAFSKEGKILAYSFGIDSDNIIYTQGQVYYITGNWPDSEQHQYNYMLAISEDGSVTFVETMPANYSSASGHLWNNGYLYYIRITSGEGWTRYTDIMRAEY